jgi:DNA repair protein RecN (Recombination protein N)
LTKLDPQPGEETGLAERRAAMMRAEKIASDIHEAEDMLSGSAAPSPLLAGLLRRLQRKAAEAPELLDDIVRAIDDALLSLDAAQASVAARSAPWISGLKCWSAPRSGCFCCVPWPASTMSLSTISPPCATRWRLTLPISMLGQGGSSNSKAGAHRARHLRRGRASPFRVAQGCGRLLRKAVMAELPALKLDRADFIIELSSDADNRAEEGIDQIEFWVRTTWALAPDP